MDTHEYNYCCGVLWELQPDASKLLIVWRPRRDLNPCYRRESTRPSRLYKNLEGAGGAVRPLKLRRKNLSLHGCYTAIDQVLPAIHTNYYQNSWTTSARQGDRTSRGSQELQELVACRRLTWLYLPADLRWGTFEAIGRSNPEVILGMIALAILRFLRHIPQN